MQRITLAAADRLITQHGCAYRLVDGAVDLFFEGAGAALRLTGAWGWLYWHNDDMQGPATILAVHESRIECHALAEIPCDPVWYCRTMAECFERCLLLRLNFFGYETHVQQVLKHYCEQYVLLHDALVRDLEQRGLQTLPQNIACQQAIQEDRQEVAALIGKSQTAGKLSILNQKSRAAAGVYIVRNGIFTLQLGQQEVLRFEDDQLVYLPAKLFSLPGYKTRHEKNLMRVGDDLDGLLALLQRCPRVPERFLALYGTRTNLLMLQSQTSCQAVRALRQTLYGGECTLHSFFQNIVRHAKAEPVLARYAAVAQELGNACKQAQEKLCADERLLDQA